MAFPIPSHLPRRSSPQDISSQILSKIDAVTNKSLNSTLAASWLGELEQTIQSTKEHIHNRVQSDLPEFERQLTSSKSVQTRLQVLSTNVDVLNESISNPEKGLIPNLLGHLTQHAELAQQSLDARVVFDAFSHLLRCRTTFKSLELLIEIGQLPDAVEVCGSLETMFQELPAHLNETKVVQDAKRQFRAAQARNEEQLSDAYSRCVNISPNELTIYPSVQVRQSETILSLPSILSSLSQSSLSNHLNTLRRDLTGRFIDHVLKQPTTVTAGSSGFIEHKLSYIPSPPNDELLNTRLENLSILFTFLSSHLFSSLLPSQRTPFTRSLCKPTTTSILNNLLIPSLPSSFDLLPPFLELAQRSVDFEATFLVEMLGNDPNDRPVKTWVDGLSGHYERQRRLMILDHSRSIIISMEVSDDPFLVEIDTKPEMNPSVVPIQEDSPRAPKDDAWGFDDGTDSTAGSSLVDGEDGWGFDDDVIPESEPEPKPTLQSITEPSPSPEIINGDEEPDPSDAWGWNDDDDVPATEETAWDDPWGDEPSIPNSITDSRPPPAPSINAPAISSPKVATRLEKAANKGKKHTNGTSPFTSPDISSSLPSFKKPPIPHSFEPIHTQTAAETPSSAKRPSRLMMNIPKESYTVSSLIKKIVGLVEDVLNEGNQFTSSKLFSTSESTSAPGTTILLSAPSVFDLYRALYPVKFAKDLVQPERGMRFSNDCLFLQGEVERIQRRITADNFSSVGERLLECQHRFKVLSDSWYHDVIGRQQQSIDEILTTGAQGFTYTGDQDRYDECEAAMNQALQGIRRLAQKFKGILAKTKYYTAIGMVADAALSRILQDVLALPDIPEVESHRLSELCRIFNAMEGLFVEDPGQPSFVVAYVPSWLKFSYLSELLVCRIASNAQSASYLAMFDPKEASMADITYLFEEGTLVDFQVDELVRLVRALFADTPLRTNTINKLLGGHPVPRH